jgi:hypothetical protein
MKQDEPKPRKEIELRPLLTLRVGEGFGLSKYNMDQIGAKKNSWLGVRYKDKLITGQVHRVHVEKEWPKDFIFLGEDSAEDLKLYDIIKGYKTDNPPPEDCIVTVKKYLLSRSKTLWPAIITLIVGVLTAIFAAFFAFASINITPFTDYKIHFLIVSLILAIITAAFSAIGVYEHKN